MTINAIHNPRRPAVTYYELGQHVDAFYYRPDNADKEALLITSLDPDKALIEIRLDKEALERLRAILKPL